ncbi:hypothetical protein Sa4125_30500 [Aureimonas sp. SA4125]|uniref:hypothetical protein n=1 Tax=Aureimonas sp. SA4125 TaxID=2826993 RepID=UPI001CC641FD|nr:hypothetical protein [Aureimonas sp. SA4125]BDA85508.1 hypothetical protein Sa4125_30500 [Aureimonas sp. SA4125]
MADEDENAIANLKELIRRLTAENAKLTNQLSSARRRADAAEMSRDALRENARTAGHTALLLERDDARLQVRLLTEAVETMIEESNNHDSWASDVWPKAEVLLARIRKWNA